MLKGKTALITGSAQGIGRAIALKLAENGASIAIVDYQDEEACRGTVEEIRALGVACFSYKCDVSAFSECEETVKKITEELGGIDILVNNAGITRDKLILQMSEADFESVIGINLKGAFNMIKCCYRQFMKKRCGKIINISSVSGIMGNAGQANYSASKAGIIGLTKSTAKELAGRSICCNAIAPGFVATEMTEKFTENDALVAAIPMKRMARPEEVASLALFLASPDSDYITGEVIRIDGGLAM